MLKRLVAFIMLIIMLNCISGFAVDTYGGYNIPVDIDINVSFIRCDEKPILINNTIYIPLRAFSDAVGGEIQWDSQNMAATMIKDGNTFVFYPGKNHCFVNGVEKNYDSVFYRDLTFIPVRAVSETFGYDVFWDSFYLTVKITAPDTEISDDYKDESYTYEDILYLGKITQIEGGLQPFKVKLGICSTIMNRVRSTHFPNSVKDVIFDTKYGVQFPPAHTDKMSVTPSMACMVAAKCALGGVNIVGKSLYFIDNKNAPSSWAHNNRPFYATIHDISFYE